MQEKDKYSESYEKTINSLADITGYESGIVVYSNGDTVELPKLSENNEHNRLS